MSRVFVAMSGGVDSSVAAALALERGHDVTGVTMQLWESGDGDNGCCSVSAIRDARRVCDLLGIPHYTWNYREIFEREVVAPFARDYAAGMTPNPCITCNDRVKFSLLLSKVAAQGADALATGHYARIVEGSSNARWLARGLDAEKDQSYFLYRLTRAQLDHVLFPVGELHKSDVRAIALRLGLPVASKSESQEICFAPDGDYAAIVESRAGFASAPGDIVDTHGSVVGTHRGITHYTVGQRKGLGVGGAAEPYYVLAVDANANVIRVGRREDLSVSRVHAGRVVWYGSESESVTAAVRYRGEPVRAEAHYDGSRLAVEFETPVYGVAPGQSVVCYRGDNVVGGGIVECAS